MNILPQLISYIYLLSVEVSCELGIDKYWLNGTSFYLIKNSSNNTQLLQVQHVSHTKMNLSSYFYFLSERFISLLIVLDDMPFHP